MWLIPRFQTFSQLLQCVGTAQIQCNSSLSGALIAERLFQRKRMEASARERIRKAFGEKHPSAWDYAISVKDTDGLLDEADLVEKYQRRQRQEEYAKLHLKRDRKFKTHEQER